MGINLKSYIEIKVAMTCMAIIALNALILSLIRKIWPSNLLFDQIVLLSVLTIVIYFLFVLFNLSQSSKHKNNYKSMRMRFSTVLIAVLIFYIFGTGVLLNVDRSRSLFVFQWVNQCSNSVKCIYDYERALYSERGVREIEQRLEEQVSRGLMDINSDKITLTKLGMIVAKAAELSTILFSLEGYKNARIE